MHPGGFDDLFSVVGTDATEAFNENFHTEEFLVPLYDLIIGDFVDDAENNPLYNFKPVACV